VITNISLMNWESSTAHPQAPREPIAIVGIGVRLPGGITDQDELWEALLEGRDCIVDIPGSRWDPQKYLDPTGRAPGRSYVQKAGMLTGDPNAFDHTFFGIPPREAAILDPQQRLLLQCSWEAFEDAGDPPSDHAGARTGVFIGGFMMDHLSLKSDLRDRDRITTHSATAATLTMLSNRLSYVFDLRGPSVSLDTACSSSLVAIHQACQSIWANESDAALAGGVNVLLSPQTQVTMAKGRFLSKTGRCQAFSDTADGYVRAEGAAVLLLKPLSAARRDGNTVHAVILGTAANSDGRTNGITVPNGDAQIAVMRSAYAQAGVEPSQVTYVEAHGTGTPVGDPIEARAIGTVVGTDRVGEPCRIGSIKTNIGHLEAGAGAAGVIKAALSLKHGMVPPHLHLRAVNPAIDLDELNLAIPTETEALPRLGGRRIAGVNSFGYGGTNAHVVLAEPWDAATTDELTDLPASHLEPATDPLLLVSARSPEALRELTAKHAEALSNPDVDLAAYCRSAAIHRSHHRLRTSFRAAERLPLIDSLTTYSAEAADSVEPALDAPKLLFVYTGMGPQWWAMGRQLYETEKVFREAVEECDDAFSELSGWSILDEMLADESTSRMARTDIAQPANAVLQIALTRLWRSWGVHADGVLGHSVGELGAAYASNALSLRDTMLVAYQRSRLQALLAGKGSMLAVGLNPEEAEACVERFAPQVSIAAVNSANSVTLAGDTATLETIAAELTAAGRFNRFLTVEVPYHSEVMAEIHDELLAALKPLQAAAPELDVYSTAIGTRMVDDRHDASYWWQNVRGTVLFADAMKAAISDGHRVFLEIGPHPVLSASIRDVLGEVGAKGVGIASLRRGAPELETMHSALRSLYAGGAAIDWNAFFGPGAYTALPKYPWQQASLWDESDHIQQRRVAYQRHPMISDVGTGSPRRFISELTFGSLPFLEDHQVAGAVIFPGAGYVELAVAAREALTGNPSCSIEDLEFKVALPLEAERPALVAATIAPDSGVLSIHRESDGSEPVLCARAKVYSSGRIPETVDIDAIRRRLTDDVSPDALYASLAKRGLRYGPRFQPVRSLRRSTAEAGEVLAGLALPEEVDAHGYHLHPVLLDGAFQSLIASVDEGPREDLIPVGIDRIHYIGGSAAVAYSHGRIVRADADGVTGDLTLLAEDGTVIAQVFGFRCQFLPRISRDDEHQRRRYTRTWVPLEAAPSAPASWLVLRDDDIQPVLDELSTQSEPVWLVDLRWASEPTDSPSPIEDGADIAEQLLNTVKSLPSGKPARYFIVTQRAEVLDADTHDLAIDRAVLLGVSRTLISERFDLGVTLVDIDEPFEDTGELLQVLSRVGDEQEIALRDGKLFCARVDRAAAVETMQPQETKTIPVAPGTAYALELKSTGTLDDITFAPCERGTLGADEVEIEAEYVPLNYKDVLKAMGLMSDRITRDTYSGSGVGMEVAGRISRVGSNVRGLAVGARAYALCTDGFRSHVIVPSHRVFALPDSVSLEASTGMVGYITAYHGLVKIARLQKGETVLVHGATGGVGLAAIELAKWIGAEVIGTAGSDEKRNHLRSLGITHVTTSRDVSFADDVMEWTEGQGVDVVLNFSPGELMTKSLACLAPFGRFIEIGKMSFEQDAPLNLRPFNENLLFASVDADRLMASRPEYIAEIITELLDLMNEKRLSSVPVTLFGASRVEDAFRLMARAKHIGKVCVAIRDPELQLRVDPPRRVRPDATYLVTGGLGGFGLETAKWLVDEGARHLALVSRRGAHAPGARDAIRYLEVRGATIRAFAADVGRRAEVATVLDDIAATMPPLRGIIHSATVLDDRSVADQDRASLDRVLGPKAQGAWNLHSLTGDLDFFVLYSSISSLFGTRGQANYVAANCVLNSLAKLRRRNGLTASVIQWGVLGETGIVARDANTAKYLEQMGLTAMSIDDALLGLREVIHGDVESLTVAEADWSRFAASLVPMAGDRRITLLTDAAGSATSGAGAEVIELFKGLSDEGRREHIQALLVQIVTGVMQMEEPSFAISQPLHEVGMDSIMGLEIAASLERALGLRLSALDLAVGPSIEQLAQTILDRLMDAAPAEPAA
jgi:acyl transferase domain-containing protein/threonine dehydrogenase-like Zn-dependent dehydrogenase/NAD(P)-dependent dehydrogenase (short-subunit alcohol dehydrogenase family)